MTLHSKKLKSLVACTRWTMVLLVMAPFIFLTSSDDDDDDDRAQTQNIVQLAQGNSNLTTLVNALTKYPDLVSTLSGNGTFTVFAPTNTAFSTLLTAIGQTSIDGVPENVLKNVLQYHVITTDALRASQLWQEMLKQRIQKILQLLPPAG